MAGSTRNAVGFPTSATIDSSSLQILPFQFVNYQVCLFLTLSCFDRRRTPQVEFIVFNVGAGRRLLMKNTKSDFFYQLSNLFIFFHMGYKWANNT